MFQDDVFEPDSFVTGGAAGTAPDPGYSIGVTPAITQALAGVAIAGASRAGAFHLDPGGYGALVMINGVNRRGNVWQQSIRVHAPGLDDPKTASFTMFDPAQWIPDPTNPLQNPTKPEKGQECIIAVSTQANRYFGGRIVRVGSKDKTNTKIPVAVTDWLHDLDELFVWGEWSGVSISQIAREILIGYCPGFSGRNIQSDGPSHPGFSAEGEPASHLFRQLADFGAWQFEVDPWRDVHLKDPKIRQSTPLLPTHYDFASLEYEDDISQHRNRIWVEGGGGALRSDYTVPASGNIVLPMDNVTWYKVGQLVRRVPGTSIHEVLAVAGGATKTITISTAMNMPYKVPRTFKTARPANFTQGDKINILVMVEDVASQAWYAKLTGRPGIREHFVKDERKNEEGCTALGQAYLVRFGKAAGRTGTYTSFANAKVGNLVQIDMPKRLIWGQYEIQAVDTWLRLAPFHIEHNVTFTDTLNLTFMELLRAQARKRKDK